MAVVHVVDDAPAIRQVIERGLAKLGHSVRAFESAVEYLGEEPDAPDVIVTDLRMPGMDGANFCTQLRGTETFAKTPIIVITGLANREGAFTDESLKSQLGVAAIITKPFSLRELGQLVTELTASAAGDSFEITFETDEHEQPTMIVYLLGLGAEKRKALDDRAQLFKDRSVNPMEMTGWSDVFAHARHHPDAMKLAVVDMGNAWDLKIRAELLGIDWLRRLAALPNFAAAYLSLQPLDSELLPAEIEVIRAGLLHPDTLSTAILQWLGVDERSAVRVRAKGPVTLHIEERDYLGTLADVSAGGFRAEGVGAASAPQPGSALSASFTLSGNVITRLPCFVRWVKPEGGASFGCGVAFAKPVPDAERTIIETFVAEADEHADTEKVTPIRRS